MCMSDKKYLEHIDLNLTNLIYRIDELTKVLKEIEKNTRGDQVD